jgi:hypothetical protein
MLACSAGPSFRLIINGKSASFDPELLSKLSSRIRRLVSHGIMHLALGPIVSNRAAESFANAITAKDFVLTNDIAFEVLDLAIDAQITGLARFIRGFVSSGRFARKARDPATDFLGLLIRHSSDKADIDDDVRNVALHINFYLNDDRLSTLSIPLLYRLFLAPDFRSIDQSLLIKFAFRQLERDVYLAIPLFLRVEFEQLTAGQLAQLSEIPEFDQVNLNYFIGMSLSASRNEGSRSLRKTVSGLEDELSKVIIESRRTYGIGSLKSDTDEQLKQLRQVLADQTSEIAALEGAHSALKASRENENRLFEQRARDLLAKIAAQRLRPKLRMRESDNLREHIRRKMARHIEVVKREIDEKIAKSERRRREARERIEDDGMRAYQSLCRNVDRMRKNCQMIDAKARERVDEGRGVRAMFAAKVIKDFSRVDNFIRQNERRFELFESEENEWEVAAPDVRAAEERLTSVERRLDRLCPIRRTAPQ